MRTEPFFQFALGSHEHTSKKVFPPDFQCNAENSSQRTPSRYNGEMHVRHWTVGILRRLNSPSFMSEAISEEQRPERFRRYAHTSEWKLPHLGDFWQDFKRKLKMQEAGKMTRQNTHKPCYNRENGKMLPWPENGDKSDQKNKTVVLWSSKQVIWCNALIITRSPINTFCF